MGWRRIAGSDAHHAYGVAIGMKPDASPRLAAIVDGKLYVFLNAAAFGKHKEDRAETLAKAEKKWPGMHHVAVAEVNLRNVQEDILCGLLTTVEATVSAAKNMLEQAHNRTRACSKLRESD